MDGIFKCATEAERLRMSSRSSTNWEVVSSIGPDAEPKVAPNGRFIDV